METAKDILIKMQREEWNKLNKPTKELDNGN
jgi:hypothetical protein